MKNVKRVAHQSKQPSEKKLMGMLPYELKKGEGYMSARMQAHFRQVLLDWKNNLTQEMIATVNAIKETPTQFADLSDRATQEEQFNLQLRERDRDRRLIKKIDETVRRIDDDTYGYCEACGEEIGLRRLEARPTAVLCVDCKTLDEIREKQEGI